MKHILILMAALSMMACSADNHKTADCSDTCTLKPPTVDQRLSQLESQVEFLQHRVAEIRDATGSITLPDGLPQTSSSSLFINGQCQSGCAVVETVPLADVIKQIMAHDGLTLHKTPAIESTVVVVPNEVVLSSPHFTGKP